MKRRLMMVERIMYVDAATPINCVFTAKVIGKIDPENLNIALAKIQQKHPLLRVSIDDEQKNGPYFITNQQIKPIPVRITERRTDDDWLIESETEWFKLFDGKNMPLARVVWVRSALVSELLLIMPHCVCDGATCVALMTEILSLTDNPEQELKPYTTFNSVKELMPYDFNMTKNSRKGTFFSFLGKLFFVFKSVKNNHIKTSDYVLHWKLDEDKTLAVTDDCKSAGTTVHAAVCVALLQAFQKLHGVKAKGKIISPANIRRFIPEIKEDNMFAFAPIVELTLDKKSSNSDFWNLARKIKTDLTAKIKEMNVYEMLWIGEYMHSTVNKMIKVLKASDGSHDITFSNMGKLNIPETYHTFKLETVYSPTVAFPWRNANTLITTTFKNQMDFTFMSNDSFMNKNEALQIKTMAMEILLAHLQQLSHA
ncbi:hypothetical protein [Mucilaginibacter aquaedulcis]|uniref:hypothetical protein n=1 Tax=Mucilaginibacter aquaedulcis TaxID=1187081 RepID=UPI0025B4ABA1|nr:hypothetical protein [Mucilaginibacter aquaedulcis]MDN3548150.1 hypothetical protein [Mucilaginibacter aquaedulcis]